MEADLLILADSAQVVGDKLFMLGGGWRFLNAPQLPVQHQMAVAVGILVGWAETNHRHAFRMDISHEDSGDRRLVTVDGEFEAGRPPGIPAGTDQQVLLAFNFSVTFEHAGQYVARLMLNGETAKRLPFIIVNRGTSTATLSP